MCIHSSMYEPGLGWELLYLKPLVLRAIKGTVSVISSYPQCKDDNARFTTVPLLALTNHGWNRYQCL